MHRVVIALLASGLLVACGREGVPGAVVTARPDVPTPSDTTATTAPPSAIPTPSAGTGAKAAFINGANAICREAEQRVNGLDDPSETRDVPAWLRSFIAILDELQGELRGLALPPGDEAEIGHYLDGNDEQVAALKAALPEVDAGAREGDDERVGAALDKAFRVYGRVAAEQEPFVQSYGFTDCGEDTPGQTTA